jgi:acid phosphatase family membrane protein YuiD
MHSLLLEYNFFYSHLLLIPIIAFLIAVFIKWFVSKIKNGKFELTKALASWGMPSVHSALVSSTTIAIAIKYWVQSDFFALAIVLTVIVMYDAINVRYEAWLHAAAINESLWKKFKESLWHLPSEAFAWSMLWIIIAVILFFI